MQYMIKHINFCQNCVHYDKSQSACLLYRVHKKETGYCDEHLTTYTAECHLCRQPIAKDVYYLLENGEFYPCHPECAANSVSCQFCKKFCNCNFKNPNYMPEIPIMIDQTVRQGNMVMQTQAPNPERLKICKECHCYHNDTCFRDTFGRCDELEF